MRSTTYSKVETGVAAIAGLNPGNILAHEKVLLGEYISDAAKYCWDYYPWPELNVVEKRYFRPEFDKNKTYEIGDEVYYDDKYFRLYDNSLLSYFSAPFDAPENGTDWHEIGDIFEDISWSKTGLYKSGARVSYNDKIYLCINTLGSDSPSGVSLVNYEWDGITPENTQYFTEVDISFERYISYEQEGKDIIGTIFSAHTGDPRYTNSTPLNWREGAEGIYFEGSTSNQNFIWLRYRKESPVFESGSVLSVPNFLTPAIKAYAFRSWLIGNGQNEKAMLQDLQTLDLLVREVDKLSNQQDRGQPFTIVSDSFRRINSQGNRITEPTREQIGGIKEAFGDLTFKFTTKPKGYNSVKIGTSLIEFGFKAQSSGLTPVIQRSVKLISLKQITILVGAQNVIKEGRVQINQVLFTAKAHQGIGIGYIRAYKFVPIYINFGLTSTISGGRYRTRGANVEFESSITPTGYNATQRGLPGVNIALSSHGIGRNLYQKGYPLVTIGNTTTIVAGEYITKNAQINISISISTLVTQISFESELDWTASNIEWDLAA